MRYFGVGLTLTVILALVTLLTALRAAWLWREASASMPRLFKFVAGSPDHVLQVESEAADAAVINSQAAVWSGATAILSALTAICGAVSPIFGR
jgi:hypothetical protein